MKTLRLVLCLSVVALLAHSSALFADSYDSDNATISKGGKDSAKVALGSKTYSAPIKFDDGADWSTVKDHYEVAPDIASGIKAGTICISVGSDGTASFKKVKPEVKPEAKEATKPEQKK